MPITAPESLSCQKSSPQLERTIPNAPRFFQVSRPNLEHLDPVFSRPAARSLKYHLDCHPYGSGSSYPVVQSGLQDLLCCSAEAADRHKADLPPTAARLVCSSPRQPLR